MSRMDGPPPWPAPARGLLEKAIERHGGRQAFRQCEAVGLVVERLGGPLPFAKGVGSAVAPPRRVVVEPHARRTTFLDWPAAGSSGIYHDGDVRLVDPTGRATLESAKHRARMPALLWRAEDVLYFFGYALVTYLSLPFVLESARLVKADAGSLTVDFPPGFDTHCTRQRFHFDESGLLVRHDYTADVVGPWATGAHLSGDYVDAGGLPVATRRRVVARIGRLMLPVPVLDARLAPEPTG